MQWLFQTVHFTLPLPEARGEFSLIFTMRTLSSSWRSNSQKCGGPSDWVPLMFLSLVPIHTEPPTTCPGEFRLSCPSPGSHTASAPGTCNSLHQPVSHSSLFRDFASRTGPRTAVTVSVCSVFLVMRESGDSRAPYTWDQKPKILDELLLLLVILRDSA